MNCANHPDQAAVAYCRNCGKALCQSCVRPAQSTIFCEEHVPTATASGAQPPPYNASAYPPPPGASAWNTGNPYSAAPGVSPGLAFVLGLIPGVGAVYNSQYAKGLIHAVIFGILISIVDSGSAGGLEPLIGILIAVWVFYMAFEAYHTALRRRRGEAVDEFSSILPVNRRYAGHAPVGPVILIGLGVVFLLNTLNVLQLREILRFWPIFLIALGVYRLYERIADRTAGVPPPPVSGGSAPAESFTEVRDER